VVATTDAERSYPAKLLLFGEYAVLLSGAAIAMPLNSYTATWKPRETQEQPYWTVPWLAYLKKECAGFLDIERIVDFFEQNIYDSEIPVGAGLGSSGALTASIYELATTEEVADSVLLKEQLGLMESFFHGKSSGLDPLVALINQPIHLSSTKEISIINKLNLDNINLYLLDSGSPRQGKEFIEEFRAASILDPETYQAYVHISNSIVSGCTSDRGVSMSDIHALSQYQFVLMPKMIIDGIAELWLYGLESRRYAIKLCGAGGGGYYLVFSEEELDQLGAYPLIKLQLPAISNSEA